MQTQFRVSRRGLMVSAAALGTLAATRALAGDLGAATAIVNTRNGPVRGRWESGSIQSFKGLRYAAPPIGALRFRPPQSIAPWTSVVDAAEFGNAAIQSPGQADMPFDEKHSEDCLFLNVWTSQLAGKRPVMVWFHGGGFSSGAASRPTYWGDHFARDGVVLVSVNHRLNVFGYTQLPDSWGPDYASSGIAGMLDCVEALKWVQANIAMFGGDPNNVTIFGESGGGAKISLLLGMPPAKGLYHKAIIQSGAALGATPRPYAQALGGALTELLGVKPGDAAALAAVDTQKVFDSQQAAIDKVAKLDRGGFLSGGFTPSIDGRALPRGPFAPEAADMAAGIPLIIGTNKDEGTMFALGDKALPTLTDAGLEERVRAAYPKQADKLIPALRATYPGYSPGELAVAMNGNKLFWVDSVVLAERKVRQGAPVWMYRMDRELPTMGGRLKAGHATELSYVFGTYDNIRDFVGSGDAPARMSRQMRTAWIAFATTGNPQSPAIPAWPPYDLVKRQTMIFNLESRVESDPHAQLRQLMKS
ncbi:para-nitrobenzyl esterase [Sphingomonas gellani]|uniref:Carboxylic ester hydrolase n=2 Tax=Sphingomonas gellani TaxID=1166340 RepID=A0A1H8JUG4_9SPHN|nr:para-nitrobenzyl esterase [Sphingomonas gellani]